MRLFTSLAILGLFLGGCSQKAIVQADGLPLQRVVVYRNGVAYFERAGHVEESEVRFKMKENEVGDFLATLAVIEKGGSSVRSAAFPLKVDDDADPDAPKKEKTPDEKKGLKKVVLSLDGKAHDLEVGYVAESPVWRPSYRVVLDKGGDAYLQAWGIVENLSGEDWKNIKLSLVAGAPLAFEAQLADPTIPQRPIVTDNGEVIAAVPHGETSLREKEQNDRDGDGIVDESDRCPDSPETFNGTDDQDGCPDNGQVMISDQDAPAAKTEAAAADSKKDSSRARPKPVVQGGKQRQQPSNGPSASTGHRATTTPETPAPPPQPRLDMSKTAPKNLRSLAAVAVEAGTTRYDLPLPVTVPDHSATMVLLLSRKVSGEALFLFAPDYGVPDSSSHPFRVARFVNQTPGVLEKGPIAVFESASFLGQGMLDPLPAGATATVPFALERALAIDTDVKTDELGERIAKIEHGELTIERDSVRKTSYRVRNGGGEPAKMLVRHNRIAGSRLNQPPQGTEDNVGTGTALVPTTVPAGGKGELVVDERTTIRRGEDWFTLLADAAVKNYLADPKSDSTSKTKLAAAWVIRKDIVTRLDARSGLAQEDYNLKRQQEETRANLKAIEKNKTADTLRAQLTKRLSETSNRLDDVGKKIVEIDSKLAELRIQFKEALRDLTVETTPPPR